MVQKFIKFIEKSQYKNRLLQVIQDIYLDNLDWYDLKQIVNAKDHYRIRERTVRVIFEKASNWNLIKEINNRWDIY
jgi:hypothetical protein